MKGVFAHSRAQVEGKAHPAAKEKEPAEQLSGSEEQPQERRETWLTLSFCLRDSAL